MFVDRACSSRKAKCEIGPRRWLACRRAIVAVQRLMHASDIKFGNSVSRGVCSLSWRARLRLPLRPRNHHFCLIYGPWFLFPRFWPTIQVPSIRKSSDKRHNGWAITSDRKRYVIGGGGGYVIRGSVKRPSRPIMARSRSRNSRVDSVRVASIDSVLRPQTVILWYSG